VCGPHFSYVINWTASTDLKKGYGQENMLRVDYDPAPGEEHYSLYINGGLPIPFRDDAPPYHFAGGGNGYIVVISPLDDFSTTPVHVIFQEQ
jgi:hypothetical protein